MNTLLPAQPPSKDSGMPQNFQGIVSALIRTGNEVLLGKEQKIKLALTALFADGHLLINDMPGVGKTTLANLISRLLGLDMQRIQFTSDLLPADITGISIFDQRKSSFHFHPGPIFSQIVLADEINRATPKTQSALLEAMEEKQVSIEGETHPLPAPFFVIATQNPVEQAGTFPLPESQLDRFLLSVNLGYPDPESERKMLEGGDPRLKLNRISPLLNGKILSAIQREVGNIHTSPALLDYVQEIVKFSRTHREISGGYSPRAAMGIIQASKAWAYIDGRGAVVPEDVQTVIPATLHHLCSVSGRIDAREDILNHVAIP